MEVLTLLGKVIPLICEELCLIACVFVYWESGIELCPVGHYRADVLFCTGLLKQRLSGISSTPPFQSASLCVAMQPEESSPDVSQHTRTANTELKQAEGTIHI